MHIKDWPLEERPREKMLRHGAARLSDAELLAIFLGTGIRGKNAVALAHELLRHFGDLRRLLDASCQEISGRPGIGPAKYSLLQAALELGKRHLEIRLRRGDPLNSPQDTKRFLRARLRDYREEVFACLFLDNRHRVIEYAELFRGTIAGASVYPRELIKLTLYHNSAAVIFAHNHPSGVAEPSQADIQLTRRLKSALESIEVRVLDHLVVGDEEVVSFAERGLI